MMGMRNAVKLCTDDHVVICALHLVMILSTVPTKFTVITYTSDVAPTLVFIITTTATNLIQPVKRQ